MGMPYWRQRTDQRSGQRSWLENIQAQKDGHLSELCRIEKTAKKSYFCTKIGAMEQQRENTSGLVTFGNLSFTMANVIQLAVFICAFAAQWYGIKAAQSEQRITNEADKKMLELKIEVLQSKIQTLETRFNQQQNFVK